MYRRWSPYNYGFNNPIRFSDPDGMDPDDEVEDDEDRCAKIENVNAQKLADDLANANAEEEARRLREGFHDEESQWEGFVDDLMFINDGMDDYSGSY